MGPINVALVQFFNADKTWRAAKAKLEAATRDVTQQGKRVGSLETEHANTHQNYLKQQAEAQRLEMELATKDAHIEKLREAQQSTSNNREYQAYLVEINTQKLDRTKLEEQAMAAMEQAEAHKTSAGSLTQRLTGERGKHGEMSGAIDSKVKELQAQVDSAYTPRHAAAGQIPPAVMSMYERLSERYDDEAMAPLSKPDARYEEYICTGCNIDVVPNTYNKLHTKDEVVNCPSCGRILFIPEDLPPEMAVKQKKGPAPKLAKDGTPKPPRKPRVVKPKAVVAADTMSGDVSGSDGAPEVAAATKTPAAPMRLSQGHVVDAPKLDTSTATTHQTATNNDALPPVSESVAGANNAKSAGENDQHAAAAPMKPGETAGVDDSLQPPKAQDANPTPAAPGSSTSEPVVRS